ncbi:hypothetical protein NMG60_11024873 [Bertholletia excelsa]
MLSNSATVAGEYGDTTVRFKDVDSYRYMVTSVVLGMIYSLLQIPIAIQRVTGGKPLSNSARLLQFDFYGDKVLLCLLATGVGAAFGATVDLKKNLGTKLDSFFDTASLSIGLLLLAFLTAIVSSILTSLALSKKG